MKQCIKKIAMSVLVLAMVITMLPMNTQAATVKLNKKAATIYVGDKVTLKLNGAKSVSWSSSNKKIATVTSKGVVKGVKAGSCKVTAKNKNTGKSYTCRVTVKALKKFAFKEELFRFNGAGNSIWYDEDITKELAGATIKVDGNKVDPSGIWSNGHTGIDCAKVKDGNHKVTISKKGYETFTINLEYEAPTFSNNLVDEGHVSLLQDAEAISIRINPAVIGKKVDVTVNGESVFSKVATDDDTNGDGYVFVWYNLKEMGEYTVTVSAEGYDDYTTVVTYAGKSMIDYVGLFKGSDGSYVDCMINKSVLGTKVSITINGETVFSDIASQENGEIIDGCWDYTYKLSEKGEYSVVIVIDGQEDYKTVVSY